MDSSTDNNDKDSIKNIDHNNCDTVLLRSTGKHRFSHEICFFPVIFPLNQSIDENNDNESFVL